MRILVVEDDRELAELMAFSLRRAGLTPLVAHDVPTAADLVRQERPDAAVLDLNLGAWNGLDLLRDLREAGEALPVLVLTALGTEDDKVRGLEAGADDYLTKPFSHRELVARVRAQLRRAARTNGAAAAPAPTVLRVGPLVLDPNAHAASKSGAPLALTATEFKLLQCLMNRAGTVVPTRTLLREVWGYDDPTAGDVVRVALHRLRRKLEDDPARPRLLHTVPGVGARLAPPE
jgi:DNA-binding response OmpR family regulator